MPTIRGRSAKITRTVRQIVLLLLTMMELAAVPVLSKAQSQGNPRDSSDTVANAIAPQPDLTYTRPTEKTKLGNYLFDAFGPYPVIAAGLTAGIDQAYNSPPEWKQGFGGYGKRFASDFGILAVTTTTRYALAEVFKQDTLYYRCDCKGVFPRLSHAMVSTFTARRDDDGHTVFSFPALIAPYAGSATAVYGWYPGRFDAKDALRMGNYSVLGYMAVNIAREFIHNGPHSFGSRQHVNRHGVANSGSNP